MEFRALEQALTRLERDQLPFAVSQALNDTANDVKRALENEIENKVDRPTPFTRRAVFVRRASKRQLTATVGIKDIQAEYLKWQVRGGTQPARRRAIPIAVRKKRNRYGNAPRGSVARALRKPNTFSGVVNGQAGVWQRLRRPKGKLKLLFAYSAQTKYQKRINLARPALSTARRVYRGHVGRRLVLALATAR